MIAPGNSEALSFKGSSHERTTKVLPRASRACRPVASGPERQARISMGNDLRRSAEDWQHERKPCAAGYATPRAPAPGHSYSLSEFLGQPLGVHLAQYCLASSLILGCPKRRVGRASSDGHAMLTSARAARQSTAQLGQLVQVSRPLVTYWAELVGSTQCFLARRQLLELASEPLPAETCQHRNRDLQRRKRFIAGDRCR